MNFAGLYEFDAITRPLIYADKIVIVFATTFLFLLAAAFSLKISNEYSRIWTGSFAVSACASTLLFRVLAARVIGYLADRQVFSRNLIVVGSGEQMRRLLAHIDKSHPRFITVLGVFAESQEQLAMEANHRRVLGTIDDIPSYIRSNDVDDVVICLPWSADEQISAILNMLRELPVNVYLGADLIGFRLPVRSAPDHFEELPLVEDDGPTIGRLGLRPENGLGLLPRDHFDDSAASTNDSDRDLRSDLRAKDLRCSARSAMASSIGRLISTSFVR